MSRSAVLNGLVLTFAATLCWAADPVDLSGHWQIDSAHSKVIDEKTASIDLKQDGNQVTLSRVYQNRDGKEATATFKCAVGAPACEFMDNGHKAKVSLWYNGPELVVLKTDGDKHDSTVEWHLQLSDGGKTLKVNREIMEPSDQTEKLVFTKAESLASR